MKGLGARPCTVLGSKQPDSSSGAQGSRFQEGSLEVVTHSWVWKVGKAR